MCHWPNKLSGPSYYPVQCDHQNNNSKIFIRVILCPGLWCRRRPHIFRKRILLSDRKNDLKIDNFAFENVENFYYLGSILNAHNKMNIEIAERTVKGSKAYYVNAKLIKSKFLKKNTKMKIYKTIIRPVVTYSSQTWTLTTKDKNNLRIFERQLLRKL